MSYENLRPSRKKIMEKHFVIFFSPGTIISETREVPIESWDVEAAVKMSKSIVERHAAKPYGFSFITRGRGDQDLDSKEIKRSGVYFLGGKILTLKEVEARKDPRDSILISNMRINGIDKIIENRNSYLATLPFRKNDTLLEI